MMQVFHNVWEVRECQNLTKLKMRAWAGAGLPGAWPGDEA